MFTALVVVDFNTCYYLGYWLHWQCYILACLEMVAVKVDTSNRVWTCSVRLLCTSRKGEALRIYMPLCIHVSLVTSRDQSIFSKNSSYAYHPGPSLDNVKLGLLDSDTKFLAFFLQNKPTLPLAQCLWLMGTRNLCAVTGSYDQQVFVCQPVRT